MKISRSSGVQLHPTSLPSGRLGPDAFAFVDWLADAGQSWWQPLPLGPPDEHGSPYKASSAFAAWPGLLADPEAPVGASKERAFRERERAWIDDWASFAGEGAIADQVRFDREWGALRAYAAERGVQLIGDVPIYVAPGSADHVAHPELFRSGVVSGAPPDAYTELGQLWGNPLYDWGALRDYARERGVRLIGDIPIYVAPRSADHLAHPELFQDGLVSGAPPDAYTELGQLWANPLYDWRALQRRGYRWWVERFRRVFGQVDLARIDHFRGFVAYWAVPLGEETALNGRWIRGPGAAVFEAAAEELGDLAIVAEDLGDITPPVTELRRKLGFPGMAVLQFAFDPEDEDGTHEPHNHEEHQVVYTGTHDNDTVVGWWESIGESRRAVARRAFVGDADEPVNWAMIRLALASRADLAMMQAQDVLGLGSEARMNVPGTTGASWKWQMQAGALTAEHAARLRALTAEAGRATPPG